MNVIPFEKRYIISPLSPDNIETQIAKEIGSTQLFGISSRGYFSGNIDNGYFNISPIIIGRNIFNPQIQGSIKPHLNGSLIKLTLRIHPLIIIFFSALFGCLGFSAFIYNQTIAICIIPIICFLCFSLFGITAFKGEASKAKEKLVEITEGELFVG